MQNHELKIGNAPLTLNILKFLKVKKNDFMKSVSFKICKVGFFTYIKLKSRANHS